jgi:hypothetical protein
MKTKTPQLSPKPFWGMIIYEKTGDGTLSGLWKNNLSPNGTILNEIARKRKGDPNTIEGIIPLPGSKKVMKDS